MKRDRERYREGKLCSVDCKLLPLNGIVHPKMFTSMIFLILWKTGYIEELFRITDFLGELSL